MAVPAGPEQAAESQASGVADPDPGSHGLGTEPGEPPAAAGEVTMSERIGGYYQEADRPVAGYLAARGWTRSRASPAGQRTQTRLLRQGKPLPGRGRRAGNWQPDKGRSPVQPPGPRPGRTPQASGPRPPG